MLKHGMSLPPQPIRISVPNAKERLSEVMTYFLAKQGRKATWHQPYDEVAEWLEDNKGLGLMLLGSCGLGKTYLARYVIPAILLEDSGKVAHFYSMQDVNKDIDAVMKHSIVVLDDIGVEEAANQYGNKRVALAEISDWAEKNGKLLIATSNLRPQEIRDRYGDRIFDRLCAITKKVGFNGIESSRATNW